MFKAPRALSDAQLAPLHTLPDSGTVRVAIAHVPFGPRWVFEAMIFTHGGLVFVILVYSIKTAFNFTVCLKKMLVVLFA